MINLEKGGRINLAKNNPGLNKTKVGLSWDKKSFDTGADFDMDASVFILAGGKLVSDAHFVFYNNLSSPDGAVVHSGDNKDGSGEGDDESVTIDLSKLPPQADEISFVVTINDGEARRQNFGQIKNSAIRLYDANSGTVVGQYALIEEFSTETSVQFGSLNKNAAGEWTFVAVGAGYRRGLLDFVKAYGGNV